MPGSAQATWDAHSCLLCWLPGSQTSLIVCLARCRGTLRWLICTKTCGRNTRTPCHSSRHSSRRCVRLLLNPRSMEVVDGKRMLTQCPECRCLPQRSSRKLLCTPTRKSLLRPPLHARAPVGSVHAPAFQAHTRSSACRFFPNALTIANLAATREGADRKVG